jgi:hypothetical protein
LITKSSVWTKNRAEGDDTSMEVLGEYHHMSSKDEEEGVKPPQAYGDEFEDHSPEGQEVFLSTARKYGVVQKYRNTLVRRIQKKTIVNDENLFIRNNSNSSFDISTDEIKEMKNDLESFFRKKGTDISGKSATDKTKTMSMIQDIINDEFPSTEAAQIPLGQDLVKIGRIEKNRSLYNPGDWVGKCLY